ncbi:MAG: Uncharacterized protein Athens071426_97 [Parcubacteria group bacterium Athens0714_26]|nr:MAG: Uncharacterized protein Athens101426_333 [Parcubacteria group bacterium Athens1014_26]TSD03703.1 MAG: Uncharacterized protein Athens071426_97 [Parcubacteria group bacterium Athens0714_26]
MKSLTKKIIIGALVAFPILSFAIVPPSINPPQTSVTSLNDVSAIIGNIINWLMGLFFVVAVLFLFYAAFLYLTAAGDEEKVKKAKNQLIYAIIAIAIALLSGTVQFIVQNTLNRQ